MEEEEIKSPLNSEVSTLCNVDSNTSQNNQTSISTDKSIWNTIVEESCKKTDFSKNFKSQDVEDEIVPQSIYLLIYTCVLSSKY